MDFDLDGNYLQGLVLSIPNVSYGVLESISNDNFGNFYVIIKNLTTRYIAKFDTFDTLLWCKKINFNNHPFYTINSSVALNNGDLLIGGSLDNSSLSIVKISSNGNLIWSKTTADFSSSINGLKELPSNEIVLTGTISENNISRNLMMKIDENGNLIWSKKYMDSFTSSEIIVKSYNEWLFTGFHYSYTTLENYPFIFSTDNNGNSNCYSELLALSLTNNNAYLTNETLTTNSLTLLPPSTINSGISDIQSYEDICQSLSNPVINQNNKVMFFPNPTNGKLEYTIKDAIINQITVFDNVGSLVKEINTVSKNYIDLSELNEGVYFLKIQTDSGILNDKVIIRK